jgi:hypothetical protein
MAHATLDDGSYHHGHGGQQWGHSGWADVLQAQHPLFCTAWGWWAGRHFIRDIRSSMLLHLVAASPQQLSTFSEMPLPTGDSSPQILLFISLLLKPPLLVAPTSPEEDCNGVGSRRPMIPQFNDTCEELSSSCHCCPFHDNYAESADDVFLPLPLLPIPWWCWVSRWCFPTIAPYSFTKNVISKFGQMQLNYKIENGSLEFQQLNGTSLLV